MKNYSNTILGSAYIYFTFDGGETWSEQQTLVASDGADHQRFGKAVAVYGHTVVVGAYFDDDLGLDAGVLLLPVF